MGFERNIVEALMVQSNDPIENADQAIDIMFNPMRHRFFAGPDIADQLVARVNDNKNCQICFMSANEHRGELWRRQNSSVGSSDLEQE